MLKITVLSFYRFSRESPSPQYYNSGIPRWPNPGTGLVKDHIYSLITVDTKSRNLNSSVGVFDVFTVTFSPL